MLVKMFEKTIVESMGKGHGIWGEEFVDGLRERIPKHLIFTSYVNAHCRTCITEEVPPRMFTDLISHLTLPQNKPFER